MKKSEKMYAMNYTTYDLNVAKDRMHDASVYLAEMGLFKDSEQLEKMIYRIEKFQNKYKEV